MTWNWQQPDWPGFSYDASALEGLEAQFLHRAGMLAGAYRHVNGDDRAMLAVDLISDEAAESSAIEGEYLNRDSLRSSIRKQLGLDTDHRRVPAAERGIAEMMVDLYRGYNAALTSESLCGWQQMIMADRGDMKDIGRYRTNAGDDPMQVVSGPVNKRRVHFEAPPSSEVPGEMARFIAWFNRTAPGGGAPLPPLIRAGIAHLYFVCIHPFEDGNGRIGRGIAEKTLAQALGQPSLIALSHIIQKRKKNYYDMLEASNKENEITGWLLYFGETVLAAQEHTQRVVDFLIEKTKLYDRVRGRLNARQDKAIARMFREGPDGFKGGLSAENYLTITGTSRATATRDLQELVTMGVLRRTGDKKGTRYWMVVGEGDLNVEGKN